jgi:hypothetical protein
VLPQSVAQSVDRFLLKTVYQPISESIWRHLGKNRLFLAWLCFGISFVSLALDVYAGLTNTGQRLSPILFGAPLLLLLATYVCAASAGGERHGPWLYGVSAMDRVIRTVTLLSGLCFAVAGALLCLRTGITKAAAQNGIYVLYALMCASGLYFVETKPPAYERSSRGIVAITARR